MKPAGRVATRPDDFHQNEQGSFALEAQEDLLPMPGAGVRPMADGVGRDRVGGMKSKKTFRSEAKTSSAPRTAPSPEQIGALAHAIWIDRGSPEGKDIDHWLEAERQLSGNVRDSLSADDLPASNLALDPDRVLETDMDRELDQIVAPPKRRSITSL